MSHKDFFYHKESADLLTPLSVFMRLSKMVENEKYGQYRLFFESIEGGKSRGRYSIIGLLPDIVWRCSSAQVTINGEVQKQEPLTSLQKIIEESHIDLPKDVPPMIGGVFGILGYDMVRQMEKLPGGPVNDLELPEAIMIRPRLFAIFDTVRDELSIAVLLRKDGNNKENKALFEEAIATLYKTLGKTEEILPVHTVMDPPKSNMSHKKFIENVKKAKEYIAAGDAFQIVPSQRFEVDFPLSPLTLYRSLRRINPAPFLFLMELGDYSLVGSSPEILVRLRDGEVTIRPLAGTRRRDSDPIKDKELEQELLNDEKELAEHLMLIDLGRNDVGRVAQKGTVQVPKKFFVERYSHVMHITSTVTGKLKQGTSPLDVLKAAFPAGTLTGAPKIRAMEILDQLEPTRRGPYAGCVGYFSADGTMDTCIGLRMALLKDGKMYVQAGAGVVSDSNPESEYQETKAKAQALFSAAELAIKQASERDLLKGKKG